MFEVNIKPLDKIIKVDSSKSLLEALKEEEVHIKSSCGGFASCSDCIIKVNFGIKNLSGPTFEEKQLLGNVSFITKERLSCQSYVKGNIEIDISKHLSKD